MSLEYTSLKDNDNVENAKTYTTELEDVSRGAYLTQQMEVKYKESQ